MLPAPMAPSMPVLTLPKPSRALPLSATPNSSIFSCHSPATHNQMKHNAQLS